MVCLHSSSEAGEKTTPGMRVVGAGAHGRSGGRDDSILLYEFT